MVPLRHRSILHRLARGGYVIADEPRPHIFAPDGAAWEPVHPEAWRSIVQEGYVVLQPSSDDEGRYVISPKGRAALAVIPTQTAAEQPHRMHGSTSRELPRGHKLASPAAVIVVVCFFMPWLTVSCAGQPFVTVSGWDIAAGSFGPGLGTATELTGRSQLYLVLLAAFAALGLGYLAWQRGSVTALDTWGLMSLGALSLFVILTTMGGHTPGYYDLVAVKYRYGIWGVVLGHIGVIVAGIANLSHQDRRPGRT